jgi:predicted Zn-dependent peptidase
MATNSSNNKEEIIEDIIYVIKNFSLNGITEEKLISLKRKAKNNISSFFKNNESVLSSMIFLEQNSLNEKYFDELYDQIDSISLDSINSFAKEFFDLDKIRFFVY